MRYFGVANLFNLESVKPAEVGRALFTCIEAGGRKLPPSPDFVFGRFDTAATTRYYSAVYLKDAGVYEVDAAIVIDCLGVVQRGDIVICGAAGLHPSVVEPYRNGNYTEGRKISGEAVLLALPPGNLIYGHWLADFLPKLYLLKEAGKKLDALTYIVPENTPKFALAFLQMLGIDEAQISRAATGEALKCERLLIPTMLHNGVQGAKILANAADFLSSRVPTTQQAAREKLFLARPRYATRGIHNIDDVEALAKSRGFELFQPELLTLPDQISAFRNADIIMGEYGSALHTSIFATSKLKVVALRGTHAHPAFIQSAIGRARGQLTGYVFGNGDDPDAYSKFTIDLPALELALERAVG